MSLNIQKEAIKFASHNISKFDATILDTKERDINIAPLKK